MEFQSGKIGIGILTYDREEYYKQTLQHVYDATPDTEKYEILVCNDGENVYVDQKDPSKIITKKQLGVSKCKNLLLKKLIELGCEHLFIIEDDILIEKGIFQEYIDTANTFGIYHLCYCKCAGNEKTKYYEYKAPNGKSISLFKNPQGAFMYFHAKVLEKCGLLDEEYINAFEHIDYEYNLSQKGLIPPFWAFADVTNTDHLIKPIEGSDLNSSITDKGAYKENWQKSAEHFIRKWGKFTSHVPVPTEPEITKSLQTIEHHYSRKSLVDNKNLLVIVPYRKREQALTELLKTLPIYLNKQVRDHYILVVEQDNDKPFNKGLLNNIGFCFDGSDHDYVCFHDVDLIPQFSDYGYPAQPSHLSSHCSQFNYVNIPDKIMGGVITFTNEQYRNINGYSNEYWGWGKEDDDLYERVIRAGYIPYKHPFGTYFSIPHEHRLNSEVENNLHLKNGARFRKFCESKRIIHQMADGLNSIQFNSPEKEFLLNDQTVIPMKFKVSNDDYTHILVDI